MGKQTNSDTGIRPDDSRENIHGIDFMAEVSREMRTPLSLIFGPIQTLLESENISATERRALSAIARNSELLLSQANALGDFATLEGGTMRIVYSRGDAADILRSITARFTPIMHEQGIAAHVRIPKSLPIEIDFEKFQYIFVSFLAHALDGLKAGSTLSCTLAAEGAYARISIITHAPSPTRTHESAISEDKIYSGDSGFFVAKKILKKMMGRYSISHSNSDLQQEGAVTTFEIIMPRTAPDPSLLRPISASADTGAIDSIISAIRAVRPTAVIRSSAQALTNTFARPHILLIERNDDLSAFIMETLSAHYDVTSMPEPSLAIQEARRLAPDLIIIESDPALENGACIKEIRTQESLNATPILALCNTDEKTRRMIGMSAEDYIRKPFAPDDLLARADNLITRKKSLENLQSELDSKRRDLSKLAERIAVEKVQTRRAYEALREHQALMQAVIDASPMAIFVRDTEGSLLYSNKLYADLLLHESNNESGAADLDLPRNAAHEPADGLRADDERIIAEKIPNQRYIAVTDTKGDRHFFVSLKFPLLNESGKPYAICGIATDITERIELEQRKNEFIASASHELKTPVTALKVLTQILDQHASDGDTLAHEVIKRMNAQIDRLTKLTGELLDLSKLQSNALQYKMEEVDFVPLMRSVARSVCTTHTSHRIVFRGARSAKILADQMRIGQALRNLLVNAIKFSPGKKRVEVTLEKNARTLHFTVRDFGIGIRKMHTERIFDCFYRIEDGTKETFPGLGIGLYLSSEIIRGHGGTIWVESVPGQGSVFHVNLPLALRKSGLQTNIAKKKSAYEKNSRS